MVSFPPCKINLGLNVIRKRPDGFHDISTCFYPVQWNDVLEIVPAKKFTFSISGDQIPGHTADNLCVRAYELLKKDFSLEPVAMHLLKIVPIGAGLGGGSADGAFALKVLNNLFGLSLSVAQLKQYAATLGSDCAFFIENKAAIGSGRGEILTDIGLSLKGKFLVIVKPDVHISTTEAFSGIVPRTPDVDIRTILEENPVSAWKGLLHNDFEDQLFRRFPVIAALHRKLYALGATFASLSGSGSALFGIFDTRIEVKKEFESVRHWSGFID